MILYLVLVPFNTRTDLALGHGFCEVFRLHAAGELVVRTFVYKYEASTRSCGLVHSKHNSALTLIVPANISILSLNLHLLLQDLKMSTNRTVALWESAVDLTALSNNQFRFCIAKSVIDSTGNLSYNMVWQSHGLAPRINIEWEVKYCLNWTLNVPSPNAKVTVGGTWQDCAKGEMYDLDSIGSWVPASGTRQAKPDYMNVGVNNYAYSGARGIHIIVGVRTPDGNVSPVSPSYCLRPAPRRVTRLSNTDHRPDLR